MYNSELVDVEVELELNDKLVIARYQVEQAYSGDGWNEPKTVEIISYKLDDVLSVTDENGEEVDLTDEEEKKVWYDSYDEVFCEWEKQF